MTISYRKARWIGVAAILAVLLLQAFNSFACYHHDFLTFLSSTAIFVGIPLLPALVSLALPNPLRAVGACVFFAPWLLFAYYTDCVRPYPGGGASMVYVAVFVCGTAISVLGALITNFITNACGATRYACSGEPLAMLNCHCRDCQQASGAPFPPFIGVKPVCSP